MADFKILSNEEKQQLSKKELQNYALRLSLHLKNLQREVADEEFNEDIFWSRRGELDKKKMAAVPIWDAICGKSAGARLCINGPAQKAIDPLIKDFTKLEERRIKANKLDVETSDLATINHLATDKIKTAAQRDASMQAFNQGRLSVPNSQATYYGMFKVEGTNDVETEARFAKELFKKCRVRIVPGTGFQYPTPGYYRLVFLDNEDNMRKAGDIVRRFADEFLGPE